MICRKCNHTLPDDSEFCQYCGNRLVMSQERSTGASDDILMYVIEEQAKETVRFMEENLRKQPDNESDEDFGLVPEKPIYTLALKLVDGEIEYLKKLYTDNGEIIKWKRRGSVSVDGVNGIVDIYDTYLPSGALYKTLFINMYGAKESTKAPRGFVLGSNARDKIKKAEKQNVRRRAYCSKCGSLIDSTSKMCTGCGKQYFKGIKFNKFNVAICVLSLVVIILVVINVRQYYDNNALYQSEQALLREVTDLKSELYTSKSKISRLQKEYDQLKEEFENYKKLYPSTRFNFPNRNSFNLPTKSVD